MYVHKNAAVAGVPLLLYGTWLFTEIQDYDTKSRRGYQRATVWNYSDKLAVMNQMISEITDDPKAQVI